MIIETRFSFEPVSQVIGRLSRRDFLGFASAAVAVAAAPPTQASTLKSINPAEAAIFQRVAEVVLPVAGSTLATWTPAVLLATLDGALLSTMEPHILAGLKGGLQYFNDGPLAAHGKRFTALDDVTAAAFLDAWGNSNEVPHRSLAMGLKKLVQLSYWADPGTWAAVGYSGPISKPNGFKTLGNAPLPVR